MIIVYRVKETFKNGKRVYLLQVSTFPFIWKTIEIYNNKINAEKRRKELTMRSILL